MQIDKWQLTKVKLSIKGNLLDIQQMNLIHGEVKKIKCLKSGLYSVTFLVIPSRFDNFNKEIYKLLKFKQI